MTLEDACSSEGRKNMVRICELLFQLEDKNYRDFQMKLIPNSSINNMIGVRTPELRNLAKVMVKEVEYQSFLEELPHQYFEEYQLHAFIISEIKDYDRCISYVNCFLPYVNNWATCDQMNPKVFKKNKKKLLHEIKKWIKSKQTYSVRFGIGMLMKHYLDDEFRLEYLEMISKIRSNEYYVNMMVAWFFATALAKHYQETVLYFEKPTLDVWTHNKAIQKGIESNRLSKAQKEYLRRLKISSRI